MKSSSACSLSLSLSCTHSPFLSPFPSSLPVILVVLHCTFHAPPALSAVDFSICVYVRFPGCRSLECVALSIFLVLFKMRKY